MSQAQAILSKTNKYQRVYNFSAGPATLPESVLEQAQSELLNYQSSGMSVMEMSHRSKEFDEILNEARDTLRRLIQLPSDYEILFLQGGATFQFSMAPLNFYKKGKAIEVIHTGSWTKKAISEAKKIAEVKTIASSEDKNFTELPDLSDVTLGDEASYIHWCSNNTIFGTQWKNFPKKGNAPWVIDMSSEILSRKFNYTNFDLIYAGAQKNVGPSGVTLVLVKKDWAASANTELPALLRYQDHIEGDSRLNTPPTFGIYIAGLVFKWIEQAGGIEAIEKKNQAKAALLYKAIEDSSVYQSPIKKEDRSPMNVVFRVNNDETLEKKFLDEATSQGFANLKGHRSIGGLRASLYNAFPFEGVEALVAFMRDFEKKI